MIATFPQRLQEMDSLYVVRNGTTYVRSAGAVRLLLTMKWYYACGFHSLGWFRSRYETVHTGWFPNSATGSDEPMIRGQGPRRRVRGLKRQDRPDAQWCSRLRPLPPLD